MMVVEPLTRASLDIALMGSDEPEVNALYGNERVAAGRLLPGLGIAMLEGGSLFCTGGIVPTGPGWAEAWAVFSPLATVRQRCFAVRTAADHIAGWGRRFRRIEWWTRGDKPWRESFAARMGYTEAWGPMKAPDGRSLWLYARVNV